MVLDGVIALHVSTSGMDAHTWVVFAIALGPSLLMMVVVALRIRQDAREDDLRHDDLREVLGRPGPEAPGR